MKRIDVHHPVGLSQPLSSRSRKHIAAGIGWWSAGAALVVIAALFVSSLWEDPAQAQIMAQAAAGSVAQIVGGPVLHILEPAYKQGIFIVTGQGFEHGERIYLYAQPVTATLIGDLSIAQQELTFLSEAIVTTDGRVYVPINPLQIELPPGLLPAYVIAYTHAGLVPCNTPIYLYENRVKPTPAVAPTQQPTPIPYSANWQMDPFESIQLSGQQYAQRVVEAPHCSQLEAGKQRSARWTTQFDVPMHANYAFTMIASGSARLSVDDDVLIDDWRVGDKERTHKAYFHLMHGLHTLQLDYSLPPKGKCKLELTRAVEFPDWCGVFRNNVLLIGPVVAIRNFDSTARTDTDRPFKTQKDPNPELYINWGADAPAPEVNPDNWSVDLTRTLTVSETGYYWFGLEMSERDEARLFVNQTPLIEDWTSSPQASQPISLTANQPNFVQVQFRDLGGQALLHLTLHKYVVPTTP